MRISVALSLLAALSGFGPTVLAQLNSTASSPPSFDVPAHVPYVLLVSGKYCLREKPPCVSIFGESDATGYASDLIYVSNRKVHSLWFQMPPGSAYRSSETSRVVNAADEVWVVLSGTLAINNPENGEIRLARAGQAVFFRRDTWHHGFSVGEEPLRVMEYFAPTCLHISPVEAPDPVNRAMRRQSRS